MSDKKIINFPNWRKNRTPIEILRSVLQYAESHPEDVKDVHIIWVNEKGCLSTAFAEDATMVRSAGLMELAKFQMLGGHTHEEDE